MWRRRFVFSLLFFLLACSLASAQPASSSKTLILESLTDYQIRLQSVLKQINDSKTEIETSKSKIDQLSIDLENSKNESRKTIDDIKSKLTKSQLLLAEQQIDLQLQEATYKRLSTELERLKASYNLSRSTRNIFIIATIAEAGVIAYDHRDRVWGFVKSAFRWVGLK